MLRLQNISKSFSGVKALDNISVEFTGATVHAICGENGAGKSTLMNIITGNLTPDNGEIFWKEKPVRIENVQQAQKLGISIVYQERSLVDSLSVAENIFPVDKPVNAMGLIDYTSLNHKASALLQWLQLQNIAPHTKIGKLSSPEKQMVEIAKALAPNPSLLILDEPTASVTHVESETLFNIMRQLKAKGVSIVYISHRMQEIQQVADVVTVLKDGCFQGTVSAQTNSDDIIRMMVGRELTEVKHESAIRPEVKLEVKNLSGPRFSNISFQLHKGEILGIAGLLGSGRTELARALFGDLTIHSGDIIKDGTPLRLRHPADAIAAGVAYIADDRKHLGLFLDKTVSENIVSTKLKHGFYSEAGNFKVSEKYKQQLAIKTPSVKQLVRKLSGGNQQKIVFAKWLNTQPDLFIINEPTHGVDVGSKAEIYAILRKLTAEGKSVIMISSELPELLMLADRIAVMFAGTIQKIVPKHEATEENITRLASGIT